MAIVISTLLKNNTTLKNLKIFDCDVPIQLIRGTFGDAQDLDERQTLDLSDKGYNSVHMIIIGGLLVSNVGECQMELDLSHNAFANTEGENWIAHALKKNHRFRLDLSKWPPVRMYFDGYKSLASLYG